MSTRTRILLGIVFILISIGIGYLLFRVFFSSDPIRITRTPVRDETPSTSTFPTGGPALPTDPGTDVTPETGDLPSARDRINTGEQEIPEATPTFNPIVNSFAQDAIASNGGVQFYNQADGKFYRKDANGDVSPFSEKVFFSAEEITWDDNGSKAIIEYPDGANIVYNFDTGEQVTLPQHWEDFSFSANGGEIAAKSMAVSPENRWLVTTDANGQNTRLIEPMGDNADKVIMDWSANRQVVAFSRTGQALGANRQEILLVGLNGENFKSLVVEGRDFRPQWTPDGDRVLYSIYSERSNFRPELWIVSASGDNIGEGRTYLNINTWADKCDFGETDSRYVYCGVPESLEEGAGFVPDIANQTRDIIYRIDTVTGARTPLTSQGDGFIVVESLQVDEESNLLYVTDKNSNALYEVTI